MARGRAGPTLLRFGSGVGPPGAPTAMKIRIRNSKTKRARKTGYRTRQKTAGGRKVNRRQRARHGSF